jgi:hypothetical protein
VQHLWQSSTSSETTKTSFRNPLLVALTTGNDLI